MFLCLHCPFYGPWHHYFLDCLSVYAYAHVKQGSGHFVFMFVLLCFCVATEFSVNKDLYIFRPACHQLLVYRLNTSNDYNV